MLTATEGSQKMCSLDKLVKGSRISFSTGIRSELDYKIVGQTGYRGAQFFALIDQSEFIIQWTRILRSLHAMRVVAA